MGGVEESTEEISVAPDPSSVSPESPQVGGRIEPSSSALEGTGVPADHLPRNPLTVRPPKGKELEKMKRHAPASEYDAIAEAAVTSLLQSLKEGVVVGSALPELNALMQAAQDAGYEDFIQTLLDNGADPYAPPTLENWNDTLQEMLQGDYLELLQARPAAEEPNADEKDELGAPGDEGMEVESRGAQP